MSNEPISTDVTWNTNVFIEPQIESTFLFLEQKKNADEFQEVFLEKLINSMERKKSGWNVKKASEWEREREGNVFVNKLSS